MKLNNAQKRGRLLRSIATHNELLTHPDCIKFLAPSETKKIEDKLKILIRLKETFGKPVPGHAFVKMESLFSNTGAIIIPEAYQDAPRCVGRVVDVAFTLNQQGKLGLEALKPGLRVIMLPESGREIIEGEDVKDFTLEYHVRGFENELIKRHTVLAIIGDDVKQIGRASCRERV